jgi:protease-4
MRTWEIAVAAIFLVACLVAGLFLGDAFAPQPVIGIARFAGEIDFDTAGQMVELLETARTDDRVAGVVLEVLSPGGFATSSETLYYTLLKLRERKPLVVVIDGLAASGGYYMAAAGNRIFAPASAYVGNVGTRGGRPSDPAIAPDELSSGPFKLEGGSRFDQIHQLDLVATAFVQNVVSQRVASPVNPLKMTAEELGEARIYLGSEALALGLIDGEGSRVEGIEAAAELAGLADYATADLAALYGLTPGSTTIRPDTNSSLFANAPPGTIFMLDSRIPLPAAALPPALEHLGTKRAADNVLPGAGHTKGWAAALPHAAGE